MIKEQDDAGRYKPQPPTIYAVNDMATNDSPPTLQKENKDVGKKDNEQKKYVPQGEKPLRAIKAFLPSLKSVQDRGGVVFKIGDFFQKNTPMRSVKNMLILGFI